MVSVTRPPGMPISALCTTSSTDDGPAERDDGTGLQPGQVEQVFQQRVQLVGSGVGGREQLGLVVLGPGDAPVPQAGDRGLDGGQRGPQVVRECGQHGGADAVGLPEPFRPMRLLGHPFPFDGEHGLGGEDFHQPQVRRRQRPPVHGQQQTRIGRAGLNLHVGAESGASTGTATAGAAHDPVGAVGRVDRWRAVERLACRTRPWPARARRARGRSS